MANHCNETSFSLDKDQIVFVKPSKPTPSEVLSFSSIDNDLNLEIICHTIYVYKSNENPSNSHPNHHSHDHDHDHGDIKLKFGGYTQNDPVRVIEKALSDVLVYYYPLAGKLKRQSDGKLQIDCNGGGVPFLVARANCQLSSLHYFNGIDLEVARKFVFEFPYHDDHDYHPLVLQVTKFSCGGFAIGMGLSHSVCDGFGAAQFFRAMVELACGKSEPSVKPVWERERLVAKPNVHMPPRFIVDPNSLATSPYMPTNEIVHEIMNVSSNSIKKLKSLVMRECGETLDENLTTLEVLSSYIWRSKVRALKLNPNGKTLICIATNIRPYMNPLLPKGYYGNAFISSYVVMDVKEFHETPFSRIVKLVKECKRVSSKEEYISNALNILEKLRELKMKIEGNGAITVLTDWRHLGLLEEIDFGRKKNEFEAVNMVPLPWNMFGFVDLCVFLPAYSRLDDNGGGVRVQVSLPKAAMPKFLEEMEGLLKFDDEDA